jgi:Antitoxin-like ribbon-helix-helix
LWNKVSFLSAQNCAITTGKRSEKRPTSASGFYAATRAGKKKVTASLDPAAHKQLRQLGLDRDMTTEALLIEAINDLFKKYAKRPIA